MVTMLVTGSNSGNEKIEIVKENGDTTVCPQMTNYPLDVYAAAGASFPDKTTVVCGGQDEYVFRADCYKLKNSQWESFGQLQTARVSHGATRIGDSIWFTGGTNYDGRLATTQILNFDGTITTGPNLPEARNRHCQTSFGNTILITGKLLID